MVNLNELRKLYKEYSKYQYKKDKEIWAEEGYWDGVIASNKDLSDRFFNEFVDWLENIKEK